MNELTPMEDQRVYLYPDNGQLIFENVTHFEYRPTSNTHRLRTQDGLIHIVAGGWRHIAIKAAAFTV